MNHLTNCCPGRKLLIRNAPARPVLPGRVQSLLLMSIGVLAIGVLSASAATITWTNIAGGNWSSPANWSPNQVPGASDNVLITAAGTYTVVMDVGTTVASLTVGAGGGP